MIVPIAAVEETVNGLFGAAEVDGGSTLWCRGRQVLTRHCDGTTTPWRAMTMEDVDRLHAVGAIDRGVANRMEIRLLR